MDETQHTTIRKFRIVAREGTREEERLLDHYNLEAVLAVGFRIRPIMLRQSNKLSISKLTSLP